MDCIFCKIIDGSIPSRKIYEDKFTYAFLDIADDVDGHTLVVPKKHIRDIFDLDKLTSEHLLTAVKMISQHYVEKCGYDGVNILHASGEAAGQTVFHFHFHIIPRKTDDNINCWTNFPGRKKTLDEMLEVLKIN
ncbi:MAG: HIT family protein [Lachnospiraceae bacterium]|nr:HIT family protein [Lachnospiraceae bacterium]